MGVLNNSLVELVGCVGVNDITGLKLANSQQTTKPTADGGILYSLNFEPQVISAISAHTAFFPYSQNGIDPSYPPKARRVDRQSQDGTDYDKKDGFLSYFKRRSRSTKELSQGKANPKGILKPSKSITETLNNTGINLVAGNKPDARHSGSNVELPVKLDVLESLHYLCLPDGVRALKRDPGQSIHHLVCTDEFGKRSYVVCCTVYRKYLVQKNDTEDLGWHCAHVPGNHDGPLITDTGQCICYLPVCIFIITTQPYFSLLKDCVSRLVWRVQQNVHNEAETLKSIALQLTMIPIPPPGHLAMRFILDDVCFSLPPTDFANKPVVDIPLDLIFQCFTLDQVLTILSCVLTEQRMVFVSENYSLLTLITMSILTFILPLEWRYTFVPVLPRTMLEYIDAPGIFIYGCHADYKDEIQTVDKLVVVDIDNSEILISAGLNVPSFPEPLSFALQDAFQNLPPTYHLHMAQKMSTFNYEDLQRDREEYYRLYNHEVLHMFLALLVNLFRDVLQYVKIDSRFFHKDQFMQSINPDQREFYMMVMKTGMFEQFLKDRFSQKLDYWTTLEKKTRTTLRRSLSDDRFLSSVVRKTGNLRSSSCLDLVSLSRHNYNLLPQLSYMQMPTFHPELCYLYYDKCIMAVNNALKECLPRSLRASYCYLLGVFKVATDSKVEALKDFNSLRAYDSRLFPVELITELMSNLSLYEQDRLSKLPFYPMFKQFDINVDQSRNTSMKREEPITMELELIRNETIDLSAFTQLVKSLEIATNQDTIKRLFDALTLQKTDAVLTPAIFQAFYEGWMTVEAQSAKNLDSMKDIMSKHLQSSESVLKVTKLVKSTYGSGRMVLTHKRLFYVAEKTDQYTQIVKLRNMESIRKIHKMFIFNAIKSIKITTKDDSRPFVIALYNQRDLWYTLIYEMWSGRLLADEQKDDSIGQQAAQNVLLIDAILASGSLMPFSFDLNKAAQLMCYFMLRRMSGVDQLSMETKDALQHRVDPNKDNSERCTVHTVLYTAGCLSSTSTEDDQNPLLWCGLSNGSICVYEASTWLTAWQQIKAKDKVVCMICVSGREVWAGSHDSTIYVINIRSGSCHQKLTDHTEAITCIAFESTNRLMFTGTEKGQILEWDTMIYQTKNTIRLHNVRSLNDMKIHQGKLWCCTEDELLILTLSGTLTQRLSFSTVMGEPVKVKCFIIAPDGKRQIWFGCSNRGKILVWDTDTYEQLDSIVMNDCYGVTSMIAVENAVWIGTEDGRVLIYDTVSNLLDRQLTAHTDCVESMCAADTRYIMTASGQHDGKVAIWTTSKR